MQEIIQVFSKDYPNGKKVWYQYTSDHYYDVILHTTPGQWTIQLELKKLKTPFSKRMETDIFSAYKENLQVYIVKEQGEDIGIITFNHQPWNNCTRVWDLYIASPFQRQGIGSQLLAIAEKTAKQWKARALILETQSCNVKAIEFYRKHQFDLVGFDLLHYSNEDTANKEVRLEMGKRLS